ncbi:MAG TPA: class I SAM-dependent methyltransferase [Candidatus Stackebrandtia faecavium]|nr:class I SAM-dependent methyltransferase [Candidatus Stackebrandtia faecavium]
MEDFDPAFSVASAKRYDDEKRGDEAAAAQFLARLATDGTALEFAIGTGRIAVPLTELGVHVSGVELSEPMVDILRANDRGADMPVTIGDMSTEKVPGDFSVVYLVYNTIFNLTTQDAQVRCFKNAVRHLKPGGAFVIEAAVPSAWTKTHEYVRPESIGTRSVGFDVCRYDPVTQILEENHVHIGSGGIRFSPIVCRLAPPAELDLMARLAGLRLRERWGGWDGRDFDADSKLHVSVYERDDA